MNLQKKVASSSKVIPTPSTQFFTVIELAERWRTSPDVVWRLCRQRKLKHTKIGGSVRISPEQAAEYLREQSIG